MGGQQQNRASDGRPATEAGGEQEVSDEQAVGRTANSFKHRAGTLHDATCLACTNTTTTVCGDGIVPLYLLRSGAPRDSLCPSHPHRWRAGSPHGALFTDEGRVAVAAGLTRVPEVGAIALKLFERSRKARDVPRLKMCRSEVIVERALTTHTNSARTCRALDTRRESCCEALCAFR